LAPYSGKIVAYSITIPRNLMHVVSLKNVTEKTEHVSGIWKPENIAKITITDMLDRK
jgi:hypothetical protein